MAASLLVELVLGCFFGFACLVWAVLFLADLWGEVRPWLARAIQAVVTFTINE